MAAWEGKVTSRPAGAWAWEEAGPRAKEKIKSEKAQA
jgi:hypothetical protein